MRGGKRVRLGGVCGGGGDGESGNTEMSAVTAVAANQRLIWGNDI